MYNRQPTPGKEGRMLITPENGSAPFYAKMQMADDPLEEGTPLTNETLLKHQTGALFGLPESAVPDDVLAFLGKYNLHWWRRHVVQAKYGYEEKQTQAEKNRPYLYNQLDGTIQYANSIVIDQGTGAISLVNPQSVEVSSTNMETEAQVNAVAALLDGKYVKGLFGYDSKHNSVQTSDVYYVPSGTKWDKNYSDEINYYYQVFVYGNQGYYLNLVTAQIFNKEPGNVDYVYSSDRNAYPDSGESDGFEWTYVGIPFENAVNPGKVVTGTYVGTGKYGAANKNTLTFDFKPQFLVISMMGAGFRFIFIRDAPNYSMYSNVTIWGSLVAEWGENSVSWYTTGGMDNENQNVIVQANSAGTYYYVAIG